MAENVVKSYMVMKSIGKSPFGTEPDTVEGEDTDSVVNSVAMGFIGTLALVAIGSGIASMYLTASMIVDVSSICLYIVAPIVVVQKAKLHKLGTLRQAQNSLREQVNQLSFAIENLKIQNIQLDLQATELSKVTNEYTKLSKQYGSQVDRLMAIVKENGEIQDKIKKNLQVQVMQSALDTILKCDTDEDFAISQKEVPQMQLRLSEIKGVEFDKANFDKLFKKNDGELKLKEIMQMFHNLKDDIPEEDNIFHLKPEKLAPTTPRSRSFLGF